MSYLTMLLSQSDTSALSTLQIPAYNVGSLGKRWLQDIPLLSRKSSGVVRIVNLCASPEVTYLYSAALPRCGKKPPFYGN